MLSSGAAELVTLGVVFPFLAVLSDPTLLRKEPVVQEIASRFGFTEESGVLLFVTILFLSAVILAAIIRLANLWLNGRFAAVVGSDLSCEAYLRTLYQPYIVHVQRNSAFIISNTTIEIGRTVFALNSLLQLVTSAVVVIALLIGLLVIDAPVAIAAAALFATAYVVLGITARRELRTNGQKIAEASSQQLKALQEGLGAIRDVLLDSLQFTYLQIYRKADRPQRLLEAKNVFLSAFPRYALEAMGIVAIALFGFLLVLRSGNGSTAIPLLGTIALGAQRLLPALQQIYSGWAALKSNNSAMQDVLALLNQPMPPLVRAAEPLQLLESFRFEDVHFRYGQSQPAVLRGLNLEIRRGERIGLVGSTGSGKSTTADILMGLLVPTRGRVLVDGQDLHDPKNKDRLVAWRAAIAHVPQSIYLADTSISENIAFGIPYHQIDKERVRAAAVQAKIADFIESSPDGYQTAVGERGIRLSGGQRQRIGIARALYKQARVMVFDEATSALDNYTEEAVMAAIEELSNELTVIIIAHRLSTLQRCDRVIRLDEGSVSDDG